MRTSSAARRRSRTRIAAASRSSKGIRRWKALERRLAAQPPIRVPAITLDGDADGVSTGGPPKPGRFVGRHEHRLIDGGIGHALPQEAPEAFARAVRDVDGWTPAPAYFV